MSKIDIRDLRVRNWVYSSFSKSPCKVTEIRLNESGYAVCKVTGVDGYKDVESLSPIPITEEILEKNGFKYKEFPAFAVNEIAEKTKVSFTYHSGSKTIFVGINKPNFNLTSSLVLYVHEMQNLLRDARIEKEITI